MSSSSSSVETHARAFADEVRGGVQETKNWMLDLGHPLLNRIADSFVKAAGVSTPASISVCGSVHSVFDQSQNCFLSPRLISTRFHCFCRGCVDRRSPGGREGVLLHGNRR